MGYGLNVVAIDGSCFREDPVSSLARLKSHLDVLFGRGTSPPLHKLVTMSSTKTMVDNVIQAVQPHKIEALHIIDHGTPSSFELGGDVITGAGIAQFLPDLLRLTPHFDKRVGYVWLKHCEVGNAQNLLTLLAALWGVPIYAAVGVYNPVVELAMGSVKVGGRTIGNPLDMDKVEKYVRADPKGSFHETILVPDLDAVERNRVERWNMLKNRISEILDSL